MCTQLNKFNPYFVSYWLLLLYKLSLSNLLWFLTFIKPRSLGSTDTPWPPMAMNKIKLVIRESHSWNAKKLKVIQFGHMIPDSKNLALAKVHELFFFFFFLFVYEWKWLFRHLQSHPSVNGNLKWHPGIRWQTHNNSEVICQNMIVCVWGYVWKCVCVCDKNHAFLFVKQIF